MSKPLLHEADEKFFAGHRGGSGKVLLVTIVDPVNGDEQQKVFSSVDLGQAWVDRKREEIHEDLQAIFVPLIVDDPDFGNRKVS